MMKITYDKITNQTLKSTKPHYALLIASCGLLMNACAIQPPSDAEDNAEAGDEIHTIRLDGPWNIKTVNTSSEESTKLHPQVNFGYSCPNVRASWSNNSTYAVLTADCYNTNGQLIHSTMDLNWCLGNFGGNMLFAHGGNFQASCQDEGWSGFPVFEANCKGPGGAYYRSSIDLNQGISNDNGHLHCD